MSSTIVKISLCIVEGDTNAQILDVLPSVYFMSSVAEKLRASRWSAYELMPLSMAQVLCSRKQWPTQMLLVKRRPWMHL